MGFFACPGDFLKVASRAQAAAASASCLKGKKLGHALAFGVDKLHKISEKVHLPTATAGPNHHATGVGQATKVNLLEPPPPP